MHIQIIFTIVDEVELVQKEPGLNIDKEPDGMCLIPNLPLSHHTCSMTVNITGLVSVLYDR